MRPVPSWHWQHLCANLFGEVAQGIQSQMYAEDKKDEIALIRYRDAGGIKNLSALEVRKMFDQWIQNQFFRPTFYNPREPNFWHLFFMQIKIDNTIQNGVLNITTYLLHNGTQTY